MGYHSRVLSTSEDCPSASLLRQALGSAGFRAVLDVESGEEARWDQLVLKHPDGTAIACIERNPVDEGTLGGEEIEEFLEELEEARPRSAAKWLESFFMRVKTIYSFQHLGGTNKGNGFEILNTVRNTIWAQAVAILQADQEGFTNEQGYHILWQFADSVEGSWWMGVLRDGQWVHFEMDLHDRKQRAAFFRGEVPRNVRLA